MDRRALHARHMAKSSWYALHCDAWCGVVHSKRAAAELAGVLGIEINCCFRALFDMVACATCAQEGLIQSLLLHTHTHTHTSHSLAL